MIRRCWRTLSYISWPLSLTAAISLGKVSRLWPSEERCSDFGHKLDMAGLYLPGINQVVLIAYLSNNFNKRGTPTSPANMPLESVNDAHLYRIEKVYHTLDISSGESYKSCMNVRYHSQGI